MSPPFQLCNSLTTCCLQLFKRVLFKAIIWHNEETVNRLNILLPEIWLQFIRLCRDLLTQAKTDILSHLSLEPYKFSTVLSASRINVCSYSQTQPDKAPCSVCGAFNRFSTLGLISWGGQAVGTLVREHFFSGLLGP